MLIGLTALSLAANLALAGFIARPALMSNGPTSSFLRSTEILTVDAAQKAPAGTEKGKLKLWDVYGKLDHAALRDRLRADGFPRDVIYNLIAWRLHRESESSRNWIERFKGPYWKSEYARVDPKQLEQERKAAQEEWRRLQELLGPNWYRESDGQRTGRDLEFGDLPVEKADALVKIQHDYMDLRSKVGEEKSADAQAKFALLEKEERADIEKLLTPQELYEYDLRRSRAAYFLREQAKAAQLTEQEYRALYPAYKAMAEKRELLEQTSDTEQEKVAAQLDADLEAEILRTLGPVRGAEFLQSKDPANEKLNRIVQRLDLPLSAGIAVNSVRKEISSRADTIRTNSALSAEQKTAQLVALAQEAESRIGGTLGARGLAAYKQYDGKWLQSLQGAKKK